MRREYKHSLTKEEAVQAISEWLARRYVSETPMSHDGLLEQGSLMVSVYEPTDKVHIPVAEGRPLCISWTIIDGDKP